LTNINNIWKKRSLSNLQHSIMHTASFIFVRFWNSVP